MDKNRVLYRVESFGSSSVNGDQPELHQELSMQESQTHSSSSDNAETSVGTLLLALTCLDQLKEAIRPRLNEIREIRERDDEQKRQQRQYENGSSEKTQHSKNSTNGLES